MELFEHLPQLLKSRYKQDITPAVRQRLEYLWKSAHAVQSTNLSHTLMKQFVELGNEYGLDFPKEVQNRACPWCSCVLLPSITSRTKVRKVGRKAKAQGKRLAALDSNSDGSHPPKLKNLLITRCTLCENVASTIPGCLRRGSKSKQDITGASTNTCTPSSKSAALGANKKSQTPGPGPGLGLGSLQKKFSFLDSLDRRSSAPGRLMGDFIPLGLGMTGAGAAPFKQQARTASVASSSGRSKPGTMIKATAKQGGREAAPAVPATSLPDNQDSSESFAICTMSIDTHGDPGIMSSSPDIMLSSSSSSTGDAPTTTGLDGDDTRDGGYAKKRPRTSPSMLLPSSGAAAAGTGSSSVSGGTTSGGGGISLLELERLSKKQLKRRKTLGATVSTSSEGGGGGGVHRSIASSASKTPAIGLASMMNQLKSNSGFSAATSSSVIKLGTVAPSLGKLQSMLSASHNKK